MTTQISQHVIESGAITSTKLSGITTAHVTEGSNLYHTTARARGSVSVTGGFLSYDSGTGTLSHDTTPTFGSVTSTGNLEAGSSSFLRFVQGSSTTPSILFGDSTGTGGTLSFKRNSDSAVAMTVDADGDVGIAKDLTITGNLTVNGTTTTINSTELSIDDKTIVIAQGTASSASADGAGIIINGPTNNATMTWDHTNQYLEFNKEIFSNAHIIGTTGTKVGRITNTAGVFNIQSYTAREISFGNDTNGEHVRIDADGKVGIGANNPTSTLEIHSSVGILPNTTSASLQLRDTTALAANNGGSIIFSGIYTSGGSHLSSGPFIKAYKLNATSGDYSYGLKFGTRENGVGNNIVGLTITPDQNVGIGVEAPQTKLSVSSGSTNLVADFISTDGTAAIRLKDSGGNVELSQASGSFNIQPGGGASVFTVSSTGEFFNSSANAAGATINGFVNLGKNADGRAGDIVTIRGTGLYEATSGNRYGNYGSIVLNSTANWTASARRVLITNGLDANKFGIISGTGSATTTPNVTSGNAGSITNGSPSFVIDLTNENIGYNTSSPSFHHHSLNTTAGNNASGPSGHQHSAVQSTNAPAGGYYEKVRYYQFAGNFDHTLVWGNTDSYFSAMVELWAGCSNGGTRNNIYVRGLWHSNHTAHLWDELDRTANVANGDTFTFTAAAYTSGSTASKLTLFHDYGSASFYYGKVKITTICGDYSFYNQS